MDHSGQFAALPPDGDSGDATGWSEVFREHCLEIRADLEDHDIRVRVRTADGVAVRRTTADGDHFETATVPPLPGWPELPAEPAVVAVHDALRGVDEGVRDGRAVVRLRMRNYRVSSTDGVDVAESGLHIHLVCEAFCGGFVGGAGLGSADLSGLHSGAGFAIGVRAADQARRLSAAVRPESMRCAAVFSPAAAGVLVHEVVGHSLETDASALWVARGTPFGPASLSIWDDARLGSWEAVSSDEEGTPLGRTDFVADGTVVGLATDRAAARRLGLPHSSGHGRRGGYAHRPAARVRHTVVGNGEDSVDSIVGGTPDGVLIESVDSGEANIRDGRFTVRVREGRRIRHGRLDETVAGFTLTGTLEDFARLDGLGDDGTPHQLLCGRGTHWLPVSGIAPTLRLPQVTVHGA